MNEYQRLALHEIDKEILKTETKLANLHHTKQKILKETFEPLTQLNETQIRKRDWGEE